MRTSIQQFSRQLVRALAWQWSLDEKSIQRRLSDFFPLITEKHSIFLRFENPQVRLYEAENRIHVLADILIRLPGNIGSSGHMEMAGSLIYLANEGAFYIDNPEICQISVLSIPSRYMFPVNRVMSNFISRYLTNVPIYKFRDNNLKHYLAKTALRKVEVHQGKLKVRFSLSRR